MISFLQITISFKRKTMRRTIISLSDEDKAWLDLRAREERVSMTEVVRQAVREYRERSGGGDRPSLDELLERTRGGWSHGDGLDFQNVDRDGWGPSR